MQNKYMFLSDLKQKYVPDRPSFNSSSDRSHLELNSQNNPFGTYNVDIFDMDYRMKKKQ